MELLDLKPFDKSPTGRYGEQIAHHLAVRSIKKATTPLEREALQKQLALDKRRALNKASRSEC